MNNLFIFRFFTQNRYNKSEFSDSEAFSIKQTLQKYMQRNGFYYKNINLVLIFILYLDTLEYSYTGYQSAGYVSQNQTQVFLQFRIPIFQKIESKNEF